MNIYNLIETYSWWRGNNYINRSKYDVLSEEEYRNLSQEQKKDYVLAPKFYLSMQEKWAKKFLKTLSIPYEKSVKQIENVYMKTLPILYEKNTEQIEDIYMKESKKNFMDGFHQFCEDNKLWDKFIYFQEIEEVKTIIRWCKKNNILFDAESPEEKYVKRFLESINSNDKKLEFNEKYDHSDDYMEKFELFCKEHGIWKEQLKFRVKEEEEDWKEFYEEHYGKGSYHPAIGMEFKLKTGYEKVLYNILKNINFSNYQWEIVQEEIIYENNTERHLPSHLSGKEFEKEISDNGNYYVISLNLQAYPIGSQISHIETYDDFLNSDCELILLFSDNEFIEVYTKRTGELDGIVGTNVVTKGVSYELKTRENDGRTIMMV